MGKHNRIQIGYRRGMFEVIGFDPTGTSRHPRYIVRCDCGKEYTISSGSMSSAYGCKKCRPGGAPKKYGNRTIAGNKLYLTWAGMRHRCNVVNQYNMHWAGRGIRVCPEWNDFLIFEAWALANGYRPGLAIDRINVDGNYEPSNCQWITRSENTKRARESYIPVRRDQTQTNAALVKFIQSVGVDRVRRILETLS